MVVTRNTVFFAEHAAPLVGTLVIDSVKAFVQNMVQQLNGNPYFALVRPCFSSLCNRSHGAEELELSVNDTDDGVGITPRIVHVGCQINDTHLTLDTITSGSSRAQSGLRQTCGGGTSTSRW
jgi:hypothetical protein